MRLIDEAFLGTPWYGSRQMARHLRPRGYGAGRMRVRRLMAKMGLAPIYQKPRTTIPHPEHRVYKYLLRGLTIDRPNQVWCLDHVHPDAPRLSLKYECVYTNALETGSELRAGLTRWIDYYNSDRPHSALAEATPDEAYGKSRRRPMRASPRIGLNPSATGGVK